MWLWLRHSGGGQTYPPPGTYSAHVADLLSRTVSAGTPPDAVRSRLAAAVTVAPEAPYGVLALLAPTAGGFPPNGVATPHIVALVTATVPLMPLEDIPAHIDDLV